MRKIILSVILIIILTGSHGWAFKNEPVNGYENIPWGTDLQGIEEFQLYKDHSDTTKIYVKKNEALRLGDAELIRVEYTTYKNRFWKVEIYYDGSKYHDQISSFLFDRYGFPDRGMSDIGAASWKGEWILISLQPPRLFKSHVRDYNTSPLLSYTSEPIFEHIMKQK